MSIFWNSDENHGKQSQTHVQETRATSRFVDTQILQKY